MENENINYIIDLDPVVEGLQTLNQGIVSNGEKLDQINEYLISKEKQEKAEKEKAAEDQEKLKEQEEKDQKAAETKAKEEQQEQETFEQVVTDIRDQIVVTNYILSGQIFFMGMIFGALFLKILWDRFIK